MNRLQQRDPFEQIQMWEQQLKKSGFVENESEILNFLQEIDRNHSMNQSLTSQLITLLALSIAAKGGKESFVLAWMEKAIRLDPTNVRANQYITNVDWKKNKDLFSFGFSTDSRDRPYTSQKTKCSTLYFNLSAIFNQR